MATKTFKTAFDEVITNHISTTTKELNFDDFTECGTYQIYEDMGNGRSCTHQLIVDKSAAGACTTQTRICKGKTSYRCFNNETGKWSEWETQSGGEADLSEIEAKLDTKADKKDTYTKSEVDSKFGGVYRYCGSATVNQNMYGITATPQRAGDVYNIATGGTISGSTRVSIPIEIPYPEDDPLYMETANVDDVNVLATVVADPNNAVFIGAKGTNDYYINPKAVIRITEFMWLDNGYGEVRFEYLSPPEDGVLDTENWEITGAEYQFDVKSGDNVVWNGKIWDILAGTVDTSNFATKDDIGDIETALDNIITVQNSLIGGDGV